MRPKLQLQPRTKPIEAITVKEEEEEESATPSTTATRAPASAPAPAPTPSANIFGAAKPVDTTAREREIEERLAKSYAEAKSREDGYRESEKLFECLNVL